MGVLGVGVVAVDGHMLFILASIVGEVFFTLLGLPIKRAASSAVP